MYNKWELKWLPRIIYSMLYKTMQIPFTLPNNIMHLKKKKKKIFYSCTLSFIQHACITGKIPAHTIVADAQSRRRSILSRLL